MERKLEKYLIDNGLTATQAKSATANRVVDLFLRDGDKAQLLAAEAKMDDMQTMVQEGEKRLQELNQQFSEISKSLLSVIKAEEKFGEFTDERARNAITLYASIIKMNEEINAPVRESIVGAGYILYAYLNGSDIQKTPFYEMKKEAERESSTNYPRLR